MMAEGYQVRLAKSGREVLEFAYDHDPLDLLILDPDLPDSSETPILEKIEDRIPLLPVVVHAFAPDYGNHSFLSATVVFVEKRGNSIEDLKKTVLDLLRKTGVDHSDIQNRSSRHRHQPRG